MASNLSTKMATRLSLQLSAKPPLGAPQLFGVFCHIFQLGDLCMA